VTVLVRFLKRYATRHVKSYALGLLFLLATTGLTVAIPTFVELAVDALEPTGPSAVGDSGKAIGLAWAIIAAGIGVMIVRTLSRVLFFNPGRVIEYHMKSDLFRHLTELPRSYYDRMRPGEVVSRGTNDAMAVRGLIGFGSLQIFNVALTLLLTIGKMFLSDWRLTLWVLVPLLVAVAVLWRAIREMFKLMRETQESLGSMSSRTLELYSGATVLQSLNATAMASERFEQQNTIMLGVAQRLAFVTAWLLPIVDVVSNFCLVLLLFVGGGMVVAGTLSPGELAAFAVLIRIVAGGLNSLGWVVNALQRGWISMGRLYEVMDAPTRSVDDGGAPMPASVSREDRGHTLEVRDLTFRHPLRPDEDAKSEPTPAVSHVSFTARPGDTVGIFGTTGAGKTTLLDLLARVHEPPVGTVFIDGVDVRSLDLKAFRGATAYVPQEAWLFSQSLRENVALAHSPAERDDARVEDAVRGAALSDDLSALPEGLETKVGERGVMLSGGQRQRTALARAFYRDFEILILDDVLSAVDHATEKKLIDAIYSRRKGATTLIVSHRVSALRHATQILVMEDGKVIARGSHDELLRDTDGPYWRAWRLQQARESEAGHELAAPTEAARG
jgi:ATP-binding cassette subfamily B multidrug efflux pump